MVRSFKISPRYTRVAAAIFSSRARRLFSFTSYRTKRQVLRAIDRIRYPRGGTKTGRALNYARRYIFAGSRRKKVLIVMTDGISYDRVARPAAALKRMGVTIICFGIGRKYKMRQLLQMASSRRHVYTAAFRALGRVVRSIKRKACQGIEKHKYCDIGYFSTPDKLLIEICSSLKWCFSLSFRCETTKTASKSKR